MTGGVGSSSGTLNPKHSGCLTGGVGSSSRTLNPKPSGILTGGVGSSSLTLNPELKPSGFFVQAVLDHLPGSASPSPAAASTASSLAMARRVEEGLEGSCVEFFLF